MEVDLQQNNQELNEEDDEYSLKHAITQKKRSYRLEIRKKKLQQTFDKTRKTNFQEASNFNEYGNNQLNNMQGNQQEYNNGQSNQQQNEMIETLYEQNKQQLQVLQQEIDFKLEYERIVFLINELNQYIYNFDPANMTQLGNTLQSILNQYLIKETPPEIMNILKQLFLHFSLHIVIKNPQVDLAIKNTAIWCLINICSWQNDQHEVIRKLIDQDIISTLKAILKEKKYSMLYENSFIQPQLPTSFLNTRFRFRDKGSIKFGILVVWIQAKNIFQEFDLFLKQPS